jgi:hypothetical protein
LRFESVRAASVNGFRLEPVAGTLLRVEGAASGEIRIGRNEGIGQITRTGRRSTIERGSN